MGNQKEYKIIAEHNQIRAREILKELGIVELWEQHGCEVNVVGSLEMKLLVKHLDIDLHIYSSGITEESSFAIVSQLAKKDNIKEIKCINGLRTDERCIEWHLLYEDVDKRIWQIDIIHIEKGSTYDGYFELMAKKINQNLTDLQRDTILRLKYETPQDEVIHGVEYYQAVMEDNIQTLAELRRWVSKKRKRKEAYWMPL